MAHLVEHHLVGNSHARGAIFEFERGRDEERLRDLAGLVRVLEDVPCITPVAPPLEADLLALW